MTAALLVATGLIVGFTLGLLGSGGSILALPLLILLAGMDTREAIPTSLAAVGAVAAWGVARQIRQGAFHFDRPVLFFVMLSSLGAAIGARLNPVFDEGALLTLFGALIFVAAVKMARPAGRLAIDAASAPRRNNNRALKWAARAAPLALGVGALSGLLGVGGGFLIVPALVILFGVAVREAAPVSLLIIALNAAAGLAVYSIEGRGVSLAAVAWFLAGGAAGMTLGQRLMRALPDLILRRVFAAVLLIMGAIMIAGKTCGDHDGDRPERQAVFQSSHESGKAATR